MHKYEIEIKSLLGSKQRADALVSRMKQKDPNLKILGSHKQLNHYFVGGDLKSLYDKVQSLLGDSSRNKLKDLAERAKAKSRTGAEATGTGNYSVRTRDADGKIILVVKATVDDTTSENGTARLEWEHLINLRLDELDELVISSGFQYQAKWSRERQEFFFSPSSPGKERVSAEGGQVRSITVSIDKNAAKLTNNIPLSRFAGEGGPSDERGAGEGKPATITVSIDKNAGYGYLAEFEMVIGDESKADQTKSFIRNLMHQLGAKELRQDRLQRMFDYYNQNWRDYYGTDKTFTID